MSIEVNHTERFAEAVTRLEQLCTFSGTAKAFWSSCFSVLAGVAGGQFGVLLRPGPEETPGWKRALAWPADRSGDEDVRHFLGLTGDIAEACVVQGGVRRSWHTAADPLRTDWCVGVRLKTEDEEAWIAAFLLIGTTEAAAEEALRRLRLIAHIPLLFGLQQQASRSEVAVSHFASVLDLVAKLNEQQRYLAMAMTLCNELATRHQCDRVSFGWEEGEYVRLQALSESERFEKKAEAVKALEAAMDEALDQDDVLVWPEPQGQHLVTREHQKFAASRNTKFLCSLPLHLDGEPVGVLTFERNTEPFAEVEIRLLSLCSDMAVRRLGELKRTDKWFGARWMTALREQSEKLIGPEHTGAKLLAIAGAVTLLVLCFARMDYRVEAPFALRAEDAAFLSAPFAGYLDEVKVDVGTEVKEGEPLATLDARDLLLEEASALADQTRFQRESEKAAAADKPAEMRIAQAQAEQAKARLELVRFRRNQSVITAPFTGVVIEGDLKKRVGAPVKQGDILFRLARTDRLTVECSVREQDVHELRPGSRGEIAFASLPKHHFPVTVERIEPLAQPKEGGNVFLVHCVADGAAGNWWRPGMSGVAKLSAGSRSPLWVLTHRTVDFLRMHFWW